MVGFYLIALIPVIIGLVLFIKSKEINWLEWLGGSVVAFAVAGIIHAVTIYGLFSDTETWSGKITRAVHYPRWVERYTETHTRTTGSGKNARTTTYTDTHYRTHPEHWNAESDIDSDTETALKMCVSLAHVDMDRGHSISESLFKEISDKFGNLTTETPWKSGFNSGDRHIYVAYNKTGYVYPVTDTKHWENRLKGSKTLFKFSEVPKDVKVYPYPENDDFMKSDRLCGIAAADFKVREFDLLNTRLGPTKKINVIICGWNSSDNQLGQYQEALWKGGKKNDFVITYGRTGPTCSWCYVFSWCEKQDLKRDMETLFVSNHPDTNLFQRIERLIMSKYELKDWSKFDYVKVEPPWWCYLILIVVMMLAQGGFWYYAYANEYGRCEFEQADKRKWRYNRR